jgi:hypothetical protein
MPKVASVVNAAAGAVAAATATAASAVTVASEAGSHQTASSAPASRLRS